MAACSYRKIKKPTRRLPQNPNFICFSSSSALSRTEQQRRPCRLEGESGAAAWPLLVCAFPFVVERTTVKRPYDGSLGPVWTVSDAGEP
jgi:hypothetical protein